MYLLAAIFALLVAAAGWFYMFYSRAADALAGVEEQRLNARRVRLRKIGGVAMMLLAISFFALFWTVNEESPGAYLLVLLSVFCLLMLLVVLALIDLRMTWRIRLQRQKVEKQNESLKQDEP